MAPANAGQALQALLGCPGEMLQVVQRAGLLWPGALHQHATGVTVDLHPCQQIAPMHVRAASLPAPVKPGI